jgi:hypothetical protein
MSRLLRHPVSRLACWYLSAFLAGFLLLPAMAEAAFVPAAPAANEAVLADLKASLENDVLRAKLASLGVTPEQVSARVDGLTAAEKQVVLADLGQVQAGGDGLVGLAVLIILIIIIVKLLHHDIVIT